MAKKDKSQKQALETTQTSDVAWLTNQWQEHPVVGLTPARLHKLLLGAEQGSLQAQADLFADMEERDGHIFSEMDKRRKGVNGLPWGINPPKNATDHIRIKTILIFIIILINTLIFGIYHHLFRFSN